jgi:hypothetical protein
MYLDGPTLDFTKSMFFLDQKVQVLSTVEHKYQESKLCSKQINDNLIHAS